MACDLIVGHNDLMSGLILHLGQTIIKAKKCVDITAGKHFSALFQTLPSLMSAMTLRKGSRSNCWYVRKHLDKSVLTADWFDHIPYSLCIRHQCFFPRNT